MKRYFAKLIPVDWIILLYIVITSILVLLFEKNAEQFFILFSIRIALIVLIITISYNYSTKSNKLIGFVRHFYPLISLLYFYPEVDILDNYIFSGFDNVLAGIEFTLFKSQPSLLFYELMPFKWFNEIMFFSYFSFYWFIITIAFHEFYRNKQNYNRIIFIIIFSLLVYYLVFIVFPASGPQFYFQNEFVEIPVHGLFGEIMRICLTLIFRMEL